MFGVKVNNVFGDVAWGIVTFGVKLICKAVFGSTKGASVVDLAEMRKGQLNVNV